MNRLVDSDRLKRLAKALDARLKAVKSELVTMINTKQNKSDSTLTTTSKTIVGAINEVKSAVDTKQNKSDTTLSTTNKTVVGAINEVKTAVDTKQNKNDNTLTTTAKTIVGAINELKTAINAINTINVATVTPVNGVLTLTTNKYQKTTLTSGATINFPTVTKFTELHLYFDATANMSLNIPDCKWRVEPNIEQGKSYEVICVYNTVQWLVNIVVYS